MSGDELRAERELLEMTGAEFGEYLAGLVGRDRAYTRQEVNAWENGVNDRKVPCEIELAILKNKMGQEKRRSRG